MTNIFNNSKRTHDTFYLNETKKIKETTKFLAKKIKENNNEDIKLLDVGCAAGAFISYLSNEMPHAKLYGADVRDDLIQKAQEISPNSKFFNLDISSNLSLYDLEIEKNFFDVCIMDGVHTIFDEVENWVVNLIKLTKKKGKIYIFGSFNDRDYDVITRVKNVGSNEWEKGWNRISITTVINEFKKYNYHTEVEKFEIGIDIEEDTSDPRRNWTIPVGGKRLTRNGLELISSLYLIECYK